MSHAKSAPLLVWRRLFASFALLCIHATGQCADDLLTSQMVDEARLWQSKGRSDLAGNTWRRILISHPDHVEALAQLGLIEVKAGNLSEARALYQRAKRQGKQNMSLTRLEALLRQSPSEGDSGTNSPATSAPTTRSPTAPIVEPAKPKPPAGDSTRLTPSPESSPSSSRSVGTAGNSGKEKREVKLAANAKLPPAPLPVEPVPPPSTEVRVTPLPLASVVTSQATVLKGDGSDDIALKPAETLRGVVPVATTPPAGRGGVASNRQPKPCRLPQQASSQPTGNN